MGFKIKKTVNGETVWEPIKAKKYTTSKTTEYTGILPITITANGEVLIDYRIYGADGGVGEPTENLWDNYFANGTYESGGFRPNSFHICGVEKIPIKADTRYSISYVSTYPYPINRQYLYEFDAQGERLRQIIFAGSSFTTSSDVAFCTISVGSTTAGIEPDDISDFMLVEDSTAPASYIPYGYKLPMVTHPELKDIGDTVLVDGDEWDIVNYNAERTVATLCKKKVTEPIRMAQKEALFVFPNGLTAGTYHFTMPQTPWYLLPNDSGKNIEFTLINDIPANGQLFVTQRNNSLIGGTISCYANPTSTTVLETTTLSEGDGGNSLESPTLQDDPVGNVNNLICATSGSAIYKNCSIRQWLNSTSSAGNVWTPANKFDRPPTWAGTLDGFMYGMDTDFIDAVTATTFTTASGQNVSYQLTDKFVPPSYTEITGSKNYGVSEGEQYQYYAGGSSDRRIKFDANDVPRSWWLRSLHTYNLMNLRLITRAGNYDYKGSSNTDYIAPTCQIDLTKLSNPWLQNNMYKSRAATTPVYIGENQLGEDEYVSFSEQKIYREVSGTLTPTDPPVPLPDIPTIEGETVIDYDGTPKPSQMYVKYDCWSGWSDIDNYKMVNGNWTQEVT